jgi:hypothetical protein
MGGLGVTARQPDPDRLAQQLARAVAVGFLHQILAAVVLRRLMPR